MRKLLVIVLGLLILGGSADVQAGIFKKKKKKATPTEIVKKKVSKYDKLLKKPNKLTAKGEFLTLHQLGQKIYIEYPLKNMNRECLLGSTLKSSSDALILPLGHKSVDPLHLKFTLRDSLVRIVRPNAAALGDLNEPFVRKAFERGYQEASYMNCPVLAYSPDSSAVVFEATALFKNNDLVPTKGTLGPVKAEKEGFSFMGVKAFSDNAAVLIEQNFSTGVTAGRSLTVDFGRITTQFLVSLLLLPEEKMKPRILDSRVGVFPSQYENGKFPIGRRVLSQEEDGFRFITFATRWRLEPVDQAAWERGEAVEVKKPIVWYLDDAFPEEWKAPLREGVLVWNQAFEKFGLKNVMQVKDFPTPEEDPEFDPDNLKYSCIRYVPSTTANAMGPSWIDPMTGEILNASVIVWNNIIKLVNEWRFVQTAQVDERVRQAKLPADVMYESMVYVSAHEIGHTLGLMHNMGASHAYPVDSLRSKTFTAKYGTTPSIMDYARNNYVAQPEDKGVKLTPPEVGVYDEYVIKWLYSPVAGNKSIWEEAEEVGKWIDEKAGDPLYRYGTQQFLTINDPSALSEDLGDDPIKAGNYGIKNLKYILEHLEEWSGESGELTRRESLYKQIVKQYSRYLENTFYMIGGIYLTNVKDGTPGQPHESVSKAKQREALKWLIKELRNCQWLDAPELCSKLLLNQRSSLSVQQAMITAIGQLPAKVAFASHWPETLGKETYTLNDLYTDLYKEAFAPTFQGKKLTSVDRLLQNRVLVEGLAALPATGTTNSKKMVENEMEALESTSNSYETNFSQRNGQSKLRAIGDLSLRLAEARLVLLKKVNALAKEKMNTAPSQDRAHYELMYRKTQKALKNDM